MNSLTQLAKRHWFGQRPF